MIILWFFFGIIGIPIIIVLCIVVVEFMESPNYCKKGVVKVEKSKVDLPKTEYPSIKTIQFDQLHEFSHFEDVFLPGSGIDVLNLLKWAGDKSFALKMWNLKNSTEVLRKRGNHPYFCSQQIYFEFPDVSYYSDPKKYWLPRDYTEAYDVRRIKWKFYKGGHHYQRDWPRGSRSY